MTMAYTYRDITKLVSHQNEASAYGLLVLCVCGNALYVFRNYGRATKCAKCNRTLYFEQEIRIYEVVESPLESESSS